MTGTVKYDEGLEEIWRIKREIAAEYPSLDEYFKGMKAYQEELKRQGVKFVRLPPCSACSDLQQLASSVAEDPPPPYHA